MAHHWLTKEEKFAIYGDWLEGQKLRQQYLQNYNLKAIAKRAGIHPRTAQRIIDEKRKRP